MVISFSRLFLPVILTGCALLFGCASPSTLVSKTPLMEAGEGLIVASLGYEDLHTDLFGVAGASRAHLTIRIAPEYDTSVPPFSIGTTRGARLDGAWNFPDEIRETRNGRRVISVVAVKAGAYTTTGTSVALSGPSLTWEATPGLSTPIAFNVRPGEIIYLGSFVLRVNSRPGFFGAHVPVSGRFDVRNEFDSDMEMVYRLRPEIRARHSHNAASEAPD